MSVCFTVLFMKTTSLEATNHVIKRSTWDEPVFEKMKGMFEWKVRYVTFLEKRGEEYDQNLFLFFIIVF